VVVVFVFVELGFACGCCVVCCLVDFGLFVF